MSFINRITGNGSSPTNHLKSIMSNWKKVFKLEIQCYRSRYYCLNLVRSNVREVPHWQEWFLEQRRAAVNPAWGIDVHRLWNGLIFSTVESIFWQRQSSHLTPCIHNYSTPFSNRFIWSPMLTLSPRRTIRSIEELHQNIPLSWDRRNRWRCRFLSCHAFDAFRWVLIAFSFLSCKLYRLSVKSREFSQSKIVKLGHTWRRHIKRGDWLGGLMNCYRFFYDNSDSSGELADTQLLRECIT